MATATRRQGHQSLTIVEVLLDAGESVTFRFAERQRARVTWGDGGVTWTIAPQNAGETGWNVAVDHSLAPSGDESYLWVADAESPFTTPSDGVEEYRIERLRFTAAGGAVAVVVAAPSRMTVEIV